MADLSTNFVGIKSPNPFWLASAPPTDKEYNVVRAFKAGWGGVVWKTLGEDPPIVNVCSRYGAMHLNDDRMVGFNNIELITDRPLEVNLREIKKVKRDWPDRALVVSLMVPCEETWQNILKRVEDTNADAVELNFGCPHGMSERGMGAAVGQVPEYVEMVTRWCKAHTRMPVLVKLTPNVTNILEPARAAKKGGADGVSLINTINSITAIDLDHDGAGADGGRQGHPWRLLRAGGEADRAAHGGGDRPRPADPRACRSRPSAASPTGATRRSSWRCRPARCRSAPPPCITASRSSTTWSTACRNWMDAKGYRTHRGFPRQGGAERDRLAVPEHELQDHRQHRPGQMHQMRPLPHRLRGHLAPVDRAVTGERQAASFEVIDEECVGCNLCMHVCPVPDCITMVKVDTGKPYLNWTQHPNNPMRKAAE